MHEPFGYDHYSATGRHMFFIEGVADVAVRNGTVIVKAVEVTGCMEDDDGSKRYRELLRDEDMVDDSFDMNDPWDRLLRGKLVEEIVRDVSARWGYAVTDAAE